MTQRATQCQSFSIEWLLKGCCEAYEIGTIKVLHASWRKKKNNCTLNDNYTDILLSTWLLSSWLLFKPGAKISSDASVCNLNKSQFHYSLEYIQLSIFMQFILTATSLTQLYSSRTWLQFVYLGSLLGAVFV